jgi:hypothetical protein
LTAQALQVLKDALAYPLLGGAGRASVEGRYSLEKTCPEIWNLFTRIMIDHAPLLRMSPGDESNRVEVVAAAFQTVTVVPSNLVKVKPRKSSL